MLKKFIISLILIINFPLTFFANEIDFNNIKKLLLAYPLQLKGYSKNKIIWRDGYEMVYDDKIGKNSYEELLNFPSLKDQMSTNYKKVELNETHIIKKNEDPGRVRYEPFFKKMYGNTKEEVEENLTKVVWDLNNITKTIWVTKINGVNKKVEAIIKELNKLPKELKSYVTSPNGGFNWRQIANTQRLSMHSFGIAIDLNVKYSHYWYWDKNNNKFEYKNSIPLEIVKIFEKYGFIWGGRWYHYDTMHFEYRPELLN